MSRLIDADKLIEILEENEKELNKKIKDEAWTDVQKVVYEAQLFSTKEMIRVLREQAYISDSYIEQIRWERDVAISQLEQLGIGFGQKIEDDVIKAVKEVNK